MKVFLLAGGCCCFLAFGLSLESDGASYRLTKLEQVIQDLVTQVNTIVLSVEEVRREITTLKRQNDEEHKQENNFLNDTTIEERVAVLEYQVAIITDDVSDLGEDVNLVEASQIIQDEKIFELQTDSENFEASIESLVATDVNLLVELSDVNDRVTNLNVSLNEVDVTVTELDTELTSLEDTVSQIDGRLSKLELSGTLAFQADLDTYDTIPDGSVVVFDVVELNVGDAYNGATGEFTVPSGGAGLYFFYVNFWSDNGEDAIFDVRVNSIAWCRAESDEGVSANAQNNGTPSCGFVTSLTDGDVVDVFYEAGTDDTPVESYGAAYNTFTGFRIAPE